MASLTTNTIDYVVPNFREIERDSFEAIKDKLPSTCFAKNRARFIKLFKEHGHICEDDDGEEHLGLFKGADEVPIHATDFTYPSYQEAYFYYLFGVIEMGCYGVIDLKSGKPILFVPRMGNLNKIWMTVLTAEDFKAKYEMDQVYYLDELSNYLE